ncbi:hypothetical protein ASC87_25955 [Rhizobacter sp. Root1221]|nr:hypothetical protein ASC87_25955 [Rhizobacter sp. Root1221]
MAAMLSSHAADVYVSTAEDGSLRYASEPLDVSYQLLLRDGPSSVAAADAGPRTLSGTASSPAREARRRALQPIVAAAASRHGMAVELVMAVIETESDFDPAAVSPAGARGAMQLMPATGLQYGLRSVKDFHDPTLNIDAGVRHLRDLLRAAGDNTALALAMYNAGRGKVARHGDRIPPFRETMLYVPTVLSRATNPHPPARSPQP